MADKFFEYYLLFYETTTYKILVYVYELFKDYAPYILLSIIIHVLFLRYFPVRKFKFTSKNTVISILISGLIGIISPLPTYVAIPIGLSLLTMGVPLSAIITFVVASPLINPSIFFLTITQLGIKLAFARVVSAYILSIFAGFIFYHLTIKFTKTETVIPRHNEKQSVIIEFYKSTLFFGKYFVITLLISGIIKALIPIEIVETLLAKQGVSGLLIAIAMGVPFYNCGGAAIPIIEVLSDMGMNDGAALAFFIAGPATKLETLYVYKSLLGKKILIFYLLVTLMGAIIFGSFLSLL